MEFREKMWRTLETVLFLLTASGVFITLHFVFVKIRFFYGVDYIMAHVWMKNYMDTGVFYSKDSIFFNFPLAVAAFGPWFFLPVKAALSMKFVQTFVLAALSVRLLFKVYPGILKTGNSGIYAFGTVLVSFFLAQLAYLNIYVEVTACLMASLYFSEKGSDRAAAFFLSLAVIFKVFLAPLFIVPVICRRFRLCGWSIVFLAGLFLVSLAWFGTKIHGEMLTAMSESYARMRFHGIGYPYVSDGFAGWQDMFNKLVVLNVLDIGMVYPLTLTLAGLYACLFFYTCYLMDRRFRKGVEREYFYLDVFAGILVFCIGFNFRFDHGTVLLTALPFFADRCKKERGMFVVSLFLVTLSRLLVEQILAAMGLVVLEQAVNRLFYVISFQFIGINLFVFLLVSHWAGIAGDGGEVGEMGRELSP